jgi:hypothetical protein
MTPGCGSADIARMGDAGRDAGFGPPSSGYVDAGSASDASWRKTDGGYFLPDTGVVPDDRFITKVVKLDLGPCGGFGSVESVLGPPVGGGACAGSTDVLSLGNGGEIVVSFAPNAIVDGPGPDFIVFENPFYLGCNPEAGVDAEPGEVSVSDDGVTWTSFTPCTDTTASPPYGACAGVHPVFSNPSNGISPFDPRAAGGDAYDLSTIGVKRASYVRIVDKIIEPCPKGAPSSDDKSGFDLDAIAVIHGELH